MKGVASEGMIPIASGLSTGTVYTAHGLLLAVRRIVSVVIEYVCVCFEKI